MSDDGGADELQAPGGPVAAAVDAVLEASVVGGFSRIGFAARRALRHWEPTGDLPRMDGRLAVVTGATSGIGRATALALAELGASLVLVGRDQQRLDDVVAQCQQRAGEDALVAGVRADLADLDDAQHVVEAVRSAAEANRGAVDVLVHNAGALVHDRHVSDAGFEQTYACQVLSPFLITTELLPQLRASDDPRVIVVASGGMYTERLDADAVQSLTGEWDGVRAYARAKRAQVELNAEWAERVPDVTFAAMHPGWAETPGVLSSLPTFARITGRILRTPEQGADTVVWLAATDEPRESGQFWLDRRPRSTVRIPGTSTPEGERQALWSLVEHQTGMNSTN